MMMNKKQIDKDINEIVEIIDVWEHRIDNLDTFDKSFICDSYDILVEKSKRFNSQLNISQDTELLENYDGITPYDVGISIVAGSIGAIIPKLTSDFFDNIHEKLSHSNGLLGKIFNHDGQWIDSKIRTDGRRVVKGTYHRFRPDGKHDLLNLSGLITSIEQFGILKGTLKYIIHLSLDCCSQTGLPVPGTTNFLYWVRKTFGMKLFSLKDQSKFAAIRMGDIAQAGVTSGILALYCHYDKVPKDSLRNPQLSILSHGISIVGSTLVATQTNNPKMLSKISYPACTVFIKNCWSFYRKLNKITKESEKLDKQIDYLMSTEPYFEIDFANLARISWVQP